MIRTKFTKKELLEAGLALSVILSGVGIYLQEYKFFWGVIAVLIISMSVYKLVYPFAVIWYTFSGVMGTIVSKLLLSLIFFLVVTPVALFKRMRGYDPMKMRPFKKSTESVFVKRDHLYTPKDLEKTY